MPSALKLRPATVDDAPEMTAIFNSAFSESLLHNRCFPPSNPECIEYSNANLRKSISSDDSDVLVVQDEQDTRILGWARWSRRQPLDPSEPRLKFTPDNYPAAGDGALAARFFQGTYDATHRIMSGSGGGPAFWFLSTVVVRRDAQRRGVGSLLMDWGLGRADAEGLAAYVNSSKEGKALYERYGFTTVEVTETCPGITAWHMRREAKAKP